MYSQKLYGHEVRDLFTKMNVINCEKNTFFLNLVGSYPTSVFKPHDDQIEQVFIILYPDEHDE